MAVIGPLCPHWLQILPSQAWNSHPLPEQLHVRRNRYLNKLYQSIDVIRGLRIHTGAPSSWAKALPSPAPAPSAQ